MKPKTHARRSRREISRNREPNPPLTIESLADGESSLLTDLAQIERESFDLYKQEPYWAERIAKLKDGLTTPFAKQIAAYLVGDDTYDGNNKNASTAEQAAWKFAQAMMLQVQPGFRKRLLSEEPEMTTAKAR